MSTPNALPVVAWQQAIEVAHSKIDAEFLPDQLKVHYMAAEIHSLRATIAASITASIFTREELTALAQNSGATVYPTLEEVDFDSFEKLERFARAIADAPQPVEPLTDEQIDNICSNYSTDRAQGAYDFARAIEAAHNIKPKEA